MPTRLRDSFGAVHALFERPQIARRAVAIILVVHTLLLGYSAYVHSPTLNEPGHLVGGLSHWKFGRFEVYRVNPPLVRMVAALPVMAIGYHENWSGFYEGPGARPEMKMGEDFITANGEQSFFLFMIARWACIPFSWLATIVCYLWGRDLFGRPAGVLSAMIWSVEPNIIAHASLITPDAHATSLGLAASYTFWRWLKNPTLMLATLTGVILGLAELAKSTLILFYPLWPLIWLVYRWPDRHKMTVRDWFREAIMHVLWMAIGLYVLNLGYGFEGSFTQLKDFHFVSDLFEGSHKDRTSGFEDNARANRFAQSSLAKLAIPFPRNYVLGIDIQQRDFEPHGRTSYLRGELRGSGWWYFYLYAVAIKLPLGLWALGILAVASRLTRIRKQANAPRPSSGLDSSQQLWSVNQQRHALTWRDEFVLLFPAIVIFMVVSSKTGFSEHMRYVLPSFPYLFIWIGQVANSEKLLSFDNRS